MFDEEVIIKEEKSPIKINIIRRLSNLFYQNSSLLIAIALAIIFTGYLFLVMMSKSTGFELSDGNIKSLGTSFGFDEAEIILFFAARTREMIEAYISFNQIWDTLFGLIYGLMYVIWVSVLFKSFSHKAGILNLFPFIQVLFDWLENYTLAALANQYLADGVFSSVNAKLASIFSIFKWVFSGLTLTLILIGGILMIAQAIKNKRQF
jgi:hypothetical protein